MEIRLHLATLLHLHMLLHELLEEEWRGDVGERICYIVRVYSVLPVLAGCGDLIQHDLQLTPEDAEDLTLRNDINFRDVTKLLCRSIGKVTFIFAHAFHLPSLI